MTGNTPGSRPKSDLAVRTISGIVMIAVALACLWVGGWMFTALLIVAALVMASEWHRLTRSRGLGFRLAGVAYVAIPVIALLLLRNVPSIGFALTLWTFLIVWATDIGAYFAGRSIGGPKLAPAISPAKTWSGLGGGVAAAALAGGVMAAKTGLPPACLWLGAPLAILAQAGDLFESALKRRAGVKDSGNILPGHGGVMDRLDGVVPVASAMGLLLWTGTI